MEENLRLMKLMDRCGHVIHHRHCLHQSQSRILSLLNQYGSMSQQELLEKMHIQSGSLSELLKKVENAGYIEKKRSTKDKRYFNIQLTAEGKKQAEIFEVHQVRIADGMFKSLSDQQKDELEEILSVLLDDWANIKPCKICERK